MALSKGKIAILSVFVLALIFYGGFKYGQAQDSFSREPESNSSLVIINDQNFSEQENQFNVNDEQEKKEDIKNIYVHITGAVENPGIYQLEEGARVNHGVELAVPTGEANLEALNLAAPLADGMKIIVPNLRETEVDPFGEKMTEYVVASEQATKSNLVNINQASAEQMAAQLPGVGPVLAGRIVDFRNSNGPFRSTEELTKVTGIGAKTFENLAEFITVH